MPGGQVPGGRPHARVWVNWGCKSDTCLCAPEASAVLLVGNVGATCLCWWQDCGPSDGVALTIPACTNTQQMSAAVAARVAQLKGNATATVAPETAAPGGLRISIPSISLNLTGAGANASTPEALSNIAGSAYAPLRFCSAQNNCQSHRFVQVGAPAHSSTLCATTGSTKLLPSSSASCWPR